MWHAYLFFIINTPFNKIFSHIFDNKEFPSWPSANQKEKKTMSTKLNGFFHGHDILGKCNYDVRWVLMPPWNLHVHVKFLGAQSKFEVYHQRVSMKQYANIFRCKTPTIFLPTDISLFKVIANKVENLYS